tara:strand:- start:1026 stop:1214 length:189 start_codon:yes stop_codon:yes gene_type:complete
MDIKLLRINDVVEKTGLNKRTIYRWMKQGKFPAQFSLGNSRSVAWRANQVDAWIKSQPQFSY